MEPFRSIPRSSLPSTCGLRRTRASACCGPQRSACPWTTSRAFADTRCPSTKLVSPHLRTRHWPLDVYAWLAHRLHRIPAKEPVFIPWAALRAQFGLDYGRMIDFKRFFRRALSMVLTRYQGARVVLDERGMRASKAPRQYGRATASFGGQEASHSPAEGRRGHLRGGG
jgi:hypothetical protein